MATIRADDRIFIAGKTGSGKTKLAESLLERFPYIVVLDNKGMFKQNRNTKQFEWKGAALVRSFDLLYDASKRFNRLVFRPDPALEADKKEFKETMDDFFWWIYNRGNCICYIDEATAVCDSYNILPGHNALMKRGRELGIGCWNSSQQPVNVHNTLMSEAEHFFIFRTQMQSHRDKLAGFMGDEVKRKVPQKYHFFYFHPESMDNAEIMNPIPLKGGE